MGFNKRKLALHLPKIALLAILLFGSYPLFAQQYADKIIAVVGRNRIILQSELEEQTEQAKQQNPGFNDSMKCLLLQQMILQKMLIEQAERDSVLISDEDVDGQLDNRIRYYTQLYGSKQRLEEVSGKTIYKLREEAKEGIREQMIAEKMQGQIIEPVKISPAEVEAFYNRIPKDSLPFFPATVEVGQIVIDPPVSREMDDYAHQKIEGIRKEIIDSTKSFEKEAILYSDDPGSRDNGGRYDGVTRNGGFAPEFLAATFKLQNGEISPIIKTKFGYHIIQMIDRKGDEADIRHILVRPVTTSADFTQALNKLDTIRASLVAGNITFPEAVGKYSTDEAAKRTGGMIADPNTGNTELPVAKLDASMVLLLDSMKQGAYSQPHKFYTETRDESCRFVYLKSRTDPHKANLRDDYSKIQEVALSQKKQQKMQQWVVGKLPTFYLKIDPQYQGCTCFKDWKNSTESASK